MLSAPDGAAVPAAWLPATSAADLSRFAATAVTVHTRAVTPSSDAGHLASALSPRRTLAVLGERHPRFDRLADRIVRIGGEAASPGIDVRRATAYELGRDDLVDLLATGPALGVYVGHGRPVGWVGYAGTRAHHLADAVVRPGHEPAAAVVSLTCQTASRRRTGLSFAESLPLRGVCAATLGAVTSTVHTGNARWALRIARDVGTARTIGDLVAMVAPHDPHATTYRLIGDPTAPLLDAPAAEVAHHPPPLEEAS
ncbi:MAG: C25 family cysteine peptidase [Pseudonocardia sp.]